jgi:hypothetical protein
MDVQEPTKKIEVQINNKKSDDQMHKIIKSIETENIVGALSQAQQQQKPQHPTVKVSTVETIIQVCAITGSPCARPTSQRFVEYLLHRVMGVLSPAKLMQEPCHHKAATGAFR